MLAGRKTVLHPRVHTPPPLSERTYTTTRRLGKATATRPRRKVIFRERQQSGVLSLPFMAQKARKLADSPVLSFRSSRKNFSFSPYRSPTAEPFLSLLSYIRCE